MMKRGFMLIELIVATMIATMVAAILLAALNQSSRFQIIIDNLVDTSVRIGVVSNQLEKDLMGVFIPSQANQKESDSTKEKDTAEQKDDDTKISDKKDIQPKTSEKKKSKPIEKIFYSTNKNEQLDTITFITNNPMTTYVDKNIGVAKPKIVRVQYSIKPENDKKDSYALFRQESTELDLEQYKNVRAYEIINGIKSCTVTFTARIEKKQEQSKNIAEDKSQERQKISYEFKDSNEWVSEQKKETNDNKEYFPRTPYSVTFKIILWDKQEKREKEFNLVFHLPVEETIQKKNKQQNTVPKKDDLKPTTEKTPDKSKQAPQKTAQNQHAEKKDIVVINELETLTLKLENLIKIFNNL